MNMKRGLVFTLCALAAAASATVGRAQTIDLSLNLRYTDPADPSEGGQWYLTARTTGGTGNLGIAGVSAFLTGNIGTSVFHGSGVAAGNGYPVVAQADIKNIGNPNNSNNPYNGVFSGATNVLYGQDTSVAAGIVGGVGTGTGAGNVASDPLKNASYNNYAVLLSGSFTGATRPGFSTAAATTTQGNILTSLTPNTAATAATITTHVRGDSLLSLGLNTPAGAGLRPADSNRDFAVNGLDLAILAANFNGTNRTWDQADSNDDGNVNGLDLALLAANFNGTSPSPAVGAVPEPSSLALFALAGGLVAAARRRRS
jgi:hypothetical protein